MPNNELVIMAPRQGAAQSPLVGFQNVVNLDIYSIPGVVALNNIMVKRSGTTVDAQVNWKVRDPNTSANIFALDANGVLYKSADSGASWVEVSDRLGVGQGLAVAWGYVFVFCVTTIDVMKISDSTWTTAWQTIDSDSLWHPAFISKNDSKIYFGAGRYVGSIEQVGTFDPANSATYTFTAQALDLPASYRIKCLEELGNNLIIGTWQGTNIYDIRLADLFPWDRSSVSFGQPVILDEFGIHAMRNIGNSLILLAGIEGIIYRSDGVNAYPIGKIPIDLRGGKYLEFFPGALCHYKNRIFFGVGSGGETTIDGMGVYSLNQTGRGNILNLEHGISTENFGATSTVKVTALLPVSVNTLLIGWRDGNSYGIDLSSSTSYDYTTDYSGSFTTPLYQIGTNLHPRTFQEIEFQLTRPLRTDEGIKVEYRDDLTASFSEVGTYTFTDLGAKDSHNVCFSRPLAILPVVQIQLKISLLGSANTSLELKMIILR